MRAFSRELLKYEAQRHKPVHTWGRHLSDRNAAWLGRMALVGFADARLGDTPEIVHLFRELVGEFNEENTFS